MPTLQHELVWLGSEHHQRTLRLETLVIEGKAEIREKSIHEHDMGCSEDHS